MIMNLSLLSLWQSPCPVGERGESAGAVNPTRRSNKSIKTMCVTANIRFR